MPPTASFLSRAATSLSVKKISKRLDGLFVGEMARLRAYEEKGKNNESLLEQI